jgi:hypothetical protein
VDHRLHDRLPPLSFNPLRNEGDAFKVVLAVGAVALLVVIVVLLARAVF